MTRDTRSELRTIWSCPPRATDLRTADDFWYGISERHLIEEWEHPRERCTVAGLRRANGTIRPVTHSQGVRDSLLRREKRSRLWIEGDGGRNGVRVNGGEGGNWFEWPVVPENGMLLAGAREVIAGLARGTLHEPGSEMLLDAERLQIEEEESGDEPNAWLNPFIIRMEWGRDAGRLPEPFSHWEEAIAEARMLDAVPVRNPSSAMRACAHALAARHVKGRSPLGRLVFGPPGEEPTSLAFALVDELAGTFALDPDARTVDWSPPSKVERWKDEAGYGLHWCVLSQLLGAIGAQAVSAGAFDRLEALPAIAEGDPGPGASELFDEIGRLLNVNEATARSQLVPRSRMFVRAPMPPATLPEKEREEWNRDREGRAIDLLRIGEHGDALWNAWLTSEPMEREGRTWASDERHWARGLYSFVHARGTLAPFPPGGWKATGAGTIGRDRVGGLLIGGGGPAGAVTPARAELVLSPVSPAQTAPSEETGDGA